MTRWSGVAGSAGSAVGDLILAKKYSAKNRLNAY